METITRQYAIEHNLNRYRTGLFCKYGHNVERYTSNCHCVECTYMHNQTLPRLAYHKEAMLRWQKTINGRVHNHNNVIRCLRKKGVEWALRSEYWTIEDVASLYAGD